jgi:membrane peptidoglycan carboxypeptidase
MSAVSPDRRGRVSNPDWPEPNWQDQQDAGHGRRSRQGGAQHEQSPWDDGAGFWRSSGRRDGQPGSQNGNGRRPAGGTASQAFRAAGPTRGAGRGREPDGRAVRPARSATSAAWTDRFSNTADDLRNRLGIRGTGAAKGTGGRGRGDARAQRADDDFWEDSPGRSGRAGQVPGHRARGATGAGAVNGTRASDGGSTQAWREPGNGRGGYRGSRRAGDGGSARLGNTAAGQGSGRTSLRDRYDETGWGVGGSRAALTGLRTRVAERAGGRGGGAGGGRGRGGWDGGRGGRDYGGPPLTGGQRFKRWLLYGRWWRHWTVKKVLGVLGAGAAAFILLCIGVFFVLYSMTPVPTAASEEASWQSSNVYLANGQLLGTFSNGGQTRQLLTAAQIPTVMSDAMMAAEDRNFLHEGGISVTGLMRAAYQDVFGDGNLQGGSTITMQYAKNYYSGVDTGQNVSTKIKEIFIAMKLGREETKTEIMTNYLNTVPFGPTVYGLGAAAEYYFNVNLTKPGATLTVSQAAMLASMPNAPGVFNPDPAAGAAYENLKARWQYVLTNMARDGNISQQMADSQTFPKTIPPNSNDGWTGNTGYLMQMVQQELEAPKQYGGYGLSQQQIDTGGLKITTTFSMAKVNELARAVNYEKSQIAALSGARFPDYDRIGAVLEDPKNGAILAVYGGPGMYTKGCDQSSCDINMAEVAEPEGSSFKPYVLSTAVNEGMSVFNSVLDGYGGIYIPYSPADTTATEMARSVMSPPAGAQSISQFGFYLNGIRYYHFPEGAENGFGKPLSVSVAAAMSSDPAFEDLAHRAGIQNIINMAGEFGVGRNPFVQPCLSGNASVLQNLQSCNDLTGMDGLNAQFSPTHFTKEFFNDGLPGSPQIALGEAPLTPVEQATTFATLANDGRYNTAHVISSVQRGSTTLPSNLQVNIPVLSSAAAANVDWALSFDNNSPWGTAEGTVSFDRGGLIAKTGTLGSGADSSEAWFNGSIPLQTSLSIDLFTNDPGTENLDNLPAIGGNQGSLGGAWPATIWNYFMTNWYSNLPMQAVNDVFDTVNGAPFVPWIQVQAMAPRKAVCRPGQFQDCTCLRHGDGNGRGNPCANPNPNPSCGPFQNFGQCNSPSPTPDTNPTPTPTPTPTPNPTPTPTPSGFSPGTTAAVSGASAAPAVVTTAAEEKTAITASAARVMLT